jgi:hypothetical protein
MLIFVDDYRNSTVVNMAKRRDGQWDMSGHVGSSTPKRAKGHQVSDSENDAYSDDESMVGHFNDPNAFMRNFGGYALDEEANEDTLDGDQGT